MLSSHSDVDRQSARNICGAMMFSHPDVDRQSARNICGAMMFEGDDALKKIRVKKAG